MEDNCNAPDSVGNQNVHVACTTGASCQPIQGLHFAASAGDADDDSDHGKCRTIRPFLDADESAVGTAVDVRHFAATPVRRDVTATAEVVKVDGKRVDFKVSASDGTGEIGSGTHQRIVINLPAFNARLAKKR